jgi:hypothetical protein
MKPDIFSIRKFPVIAALIAFCLSAGLLVQCTKPQPAATGKDQLVAALDAAFIQILSNGKWRQITQPLGPLVVNIADCYPTPDDAPFPADPTGALADILNSRKIRVGSYPDKYSGSFDAYTEVNEQLLRAMLDELGAAYKLPAPIEIERVYIDPPSSSILFTKLNEGAFDISDLNSALGGVSNSQRRRSMARYTCTIFGSGWFLQVKENSSYKTIADFQADPGAKLCSGMLSSQLGKDYFVNQQITSQYENDLELCGQGVLDGTYDAYLHFDPVPVKNGLRSIDTGIVSGVPYWVAGGEDE